MNQQKGRSGIYQNKGAGNVTNNDIAPNQSKLFAPEQVTLLPARR